jgi:AcrR family transcriptional regulator
MLSERGWDGLRLPELAGKAGVTRPIVYRHFRSRQQLALELVRGYAAALQATLQEAVRRYPDRPEQALRQALNGLCDLIEERGIGPWNLLTTSAPDPALDQALGEVRDELLRPWAPRIRLITVASARDADVLSRLTVAVVRTVIERWAEGGLSRREAERFLAQSLGGLLAAFTNTRARTR